MTSFLPCVEHEPRSVARFSIIWLHGLGADGYDFAPIVPQLELPEELPLRFVFPHAPQRPITINNGYVMPAWFDIVSFDRQDLVDYDGILATVEQVNALIQREIDRGVDSKHIILAGFSQGGAVAMHAALRYPLPLGGLLVLSSYLPAADRLEPCRHPINQAIPIFMTHGSLDPVLPIALGLKSSRALIDMAYGVKWKDYPMEHSLCAEEIMDISAWLMALPAFNNH